MTNQNPLISVIVPVYRVEQYLHRCVDSILAQTYTNLEIILVDDGSPDCCGEICEGYAAKDSRIRVIHQENGGVSTARNAGLDVCTGEYICFVDSDDYIHPEMYEKMLFAQLEHQVDICVCQWQYEFADGRHPITPEMIDPTIFDVKTSRELARYFYGEPIEILTSVVVWNKMYKRELLCDLRFCGRMMEDEAYLTELLSGNKTVWVMPQLFYVYVQNNASLTAAPFQQGSLRFLDILLDRARLYSSDPYMWRESLIRYCNVYIDYYYLAKEKQLVMPGKTSVLSSAWKLAISGETDLKFLMRMLLFLISPALYRFLVSKFSKSQRNQL